MNIPITLIFAIVLVIAVFIAYKLGSYKKEAQWQKNLVSLRKQIAEKQRVGIKGRVTETFAPFLNGFPYKSSECKFLGDPIDYVVFEGLDERDIKAIRFVEVKEGTSRLSKHQKQIKDLIDEADPEKISFETFNFDSEN